MARYKVYDMDHFKLVEIGEIEAAHDVEAIQVARDHGRGDHLEIWEGNRKVCVVNPAARRA